MNTLEQLKLIRDDFSYEWENFMLDDKPALAQIAKDKLDAIDSMIGLLETAHRLEQIEAMNDARLDEMADRQDQLEAARDNYEPPDPPGFEGGFADNH